jgi:hypothetical protein
MPERGRCQRLQLLSLCDVTAKCVSSRELANKGAKYKADLSALKWPGGVAWKVCEMRCDGAGLEESETRMRKVDQAQRH